MKTEDIQRYEEASRQPIMVGDEVYVSAQKSRGRVMEAIDGHLTVRLSNGSVVDLPISQRTPPEKQFSVLRVSGIL